MPDTSRRRVAPNLIRGVAQPRRLSRVAVALLTTAWAATVSLAAPPTITSITPRGAERGKAVEVTVAGASLTPKTQLILPFPATQKLLPDAKPNPAQVRFQITVDARVPPGVYPLRVLTEDGVSGLALFAVDAFPNVAEVEDNSSFEKAQKVALPAVIDGQCGGGDEDYYRVTAKKGQRVVVEAVAARLGSAVLPQLRVTDGRRRFVAADASGKLRGDCRVAFVAAEDGEYVVEFSDSRYRGGTPPHYRLRIGEYDYAEEVFPLGGRRGEQTTFTLRAGTVTGEAKTQQALTPLPPPWFSPAWRPLDLQGSPLRPGMLSPEVALGEYPEQMYAKGLTLKAPVTVNGRLARDGEVHRFEMPVQPGQRYRFQVEAEGLGSFLDGVLRLTDAKGKELAKGDDVDVPPAAPGLQATRSADPSLDFTVPADVKLLAVEVRDGLERGGVNFGYRLTVEPAADDFALEQTAAEINVPLGGTAAVPVGVLRRGYNGPVTLALPNLPPGLTTQGGYVPEGGTGGVLTVTASGLLSAPAYLTVEGKAIGKDVVRRATQRFVVSKEANVDASTVELGHFALATTSAVPVALQGPDKLEVVIGYPATVNVKVTRKAKPPLPPVEVNAVAPPAAGGKPPVNVLTVKPATVPADKDTAALTVTVPLTAPAGRFADLVLQGKAKVDNKDVLISAPAVPVSVVRPFAVELAAAKLELTPGKAATLKGKVQRHPLFKEAVQLKLEGLPKGVALAGAPKPVAANQGDFQLDLTVDTKAPPATATLTLTTSATIGGMIYSHPTVNLPVQVQAVKK